MRLAGPQRQHPLGPVQRLDLRLLIHARHQGFVGRMVHTVSVSRNGRVRLERVDVAHETGFGLVNIRFFETGHWLIGMGHDRATSVQSAIGDAVFQVTGKRFRDLPYGRHDLSWG
ncbi:MAG: hypothetical protein HY701_07090 [Gemmatimonadetes bacterium]|nr:hypothetical protein [Gemmatimonadota bacterium]